MDRLKAQIDFIIEIDKLKQILRRSYVTDGSRHENDAEHSWHLAAVILVLSEYSTEPIDTLKALKMALIHDLVEIDTGDVFVYDEAQRNHAMEAEKAAADRIFRMLPDDQASEFRALWEEFEARATPESKFVRALDRLQPILLNYQNKGRAWIENRVTVEMALALNLPILLDGAPRLAEFVERLLSSAAERGYFHT